MRLVFILFLLAFRTYAPGLVYTDIHTSAYYYSTWCGNSRQTSLMFEDAVKRYTKKYNVPTWIIERQLMAESGYNCHAISTKGCLGAPQLEPNEYNIAFIKETENYKPEIPAIDQFHHIYPSVEVQCCLWRIYWGMYSNWEQASVAYWAGWRSDEMKRYKAGKLKYKETRYFKVIFIDGYIEENLIKIK